MEQYLAKIKMFEIQYFNFKKGKKTPFFRYLLLSILFQNDKKTWHLPRNILYLTYFQLKKWVNFPYKLFLVYFSRVTLSRIFLAVSFVENAYRFSTFMNFLPKQDSFANLKIEFKRDFKEEKKQFSRISTEIFKGEKTFSK